MAGESALAVKKSQRRGKKGADVLKARRPF